MKPGRKPVQQGKNIHVKRNQKPESCFALATYTSGSVLAAFCCKAHNFW